MFTNRVRLKVVSLLLASGLTGWMPMSFAQASEAANASLLLGLDFVVVRWQHEDCQSTSEATRGALFRASPKIIGGMLGALGAVLAGSNVVEDALIGVAAGEIVEKVAGKRLEALGGAATTYEREVARTVCETYDRAEKTRKPILTALVEVLGDPCGIDPEDADGGGERLVQKLRLCASADPAVLALAGTYAQALWDANHAACVSAAAAIKSITKKYTRLAIGNSSFLPTPIMATCGGGKQALSDWAPIRFVP